MNETPVRGMENPAAHATHVRRTTLRPWIERAWNSDKEPSLLLRAAAAVYAPITAMARARAAQARRRVEGLRVVAIGGLAVGGAGKTTLARWAAREALVLGLRPALLLRGHGSRAAHGGAPTVVPSGDRAPEASARFGDEALAHRAALPAEVTVLVGADRFAAAREAHRRNANLVILDDGWEQAGLAWDSLWVTLDPARPFGNGRTLPAGPLRRPPSNLQQANVLVLISETALEAAGATPLGPDQTILRFARRIDGWSNLDGREVEAPEGDVIVVSSVGSPGRLERFLAGSGLRIREHIAFPDHGAWDRALVERAVARGRAGTGTSGAGAGAVVAVVATDKDSVRAGALGDVGIPIQIVRSTIEPLDDPAPLRAALAGAAPIR